MNKLMRENEFVKAAVYLLAPVVLMLVMVACDANPATAGDGWTHIEGSEMGASVYYGEIELPDGRTIPCLAWTAVNKGGLSCDWGER